MATTLQVPPARAHNVPAGIGLMLLAIFLFSANDALGKWLVGTYSVGQILLIRSAVALLVLSPWLWKAGLPLLLSLRRPGLQALRMVFSTLEVACFYWAVAGLPLADVTTYYLAAPICVTALSVPILGEHVGWRRWAAVAIGFAGVLLALQPGSADVSGSTVLALLGTLFFAGLIITTRQLAATPAILLVGTQTLAALLFGLLVAPFTWVSPTAFDLGLLGLLGVVAMLAHVCLNQSLTLAPASVVVPYQYTMVVWAALLGFAVFGDIPAPNVLVGAGIIIGAGLFIFFRERTPRAAQ